MPQALLMVALAALVALSFLGSLVVGPAALTWATSLSALFGGDNEAARIVMQDIRLPRAILGAMIGATLGLTGATLQGLSCAIRSPIPGVLGISSTAALGAVLAIFTGASAAWTFALPTAAIRGRRRRRRAPSCARWTERWHIDAHSRGRCHQLPGWQP